MQRLYFDITVPVDCSTLHHYMLSESGYRQWTAAFDANSRFIGDWRVGSLMHFVGTPEGEEKACGIVSRVLQNELGQQVLLEHIGLLTDGEVQLSGEAVAQFAGAKECYQFQPVLPEPTSQAQAPLPHAGTQGSTKLSIYIDTLPAWHDYFVTTWPLALQALQKHFIEMPQATLS